MSFGGEEGIDFATIRGRDWPSVRQFNVFLENRLGILLDLVRRFEMTDVKVVSMTVVDSSDCAIIRVVPSDYERAFEVLEAAKLPFTESDLLVVQVPEHDQPLLQMCKALLSAEISIRYLYPLLVTVDQKAAVAIAVDDFEVAAQALQNQGFTLFSEGDLSH